jgi:hypothetical protein
MSTTTTARVGETPTVDITKRIDTHEVLTAFDTWGGSWGASWGMTWRSIPSLADQGHTKRVSSTSTTTTTKRVTGI